MKEGIFGKIIVFPAVLAVALTLFLAVLVLRQEDARRRDGLDMEAFQILAGVTDLWNETGTFDPGLWRGVAGFGVYGAGGAAVYAWGTAPRALYASRLAAPGGETLLEGDSLRLVRRIGTAPSYRGAEGRRNMMGAGGMGMGMMGSPMAPSRYVLIDLDVSERLRQRTPLLYLVSFLLALFVALVVLVVLFYRRLAVYRERERETAHLVQLGEAARTLAHEIKNPLGVIKVQCATLKRTVGEDRAKNVTVIEEETDRLAQLTDRVRDFLHSSPGRPETRSARSYLDQSRDRWGDRLSVAEPGEDSARCAVSMDPARLTQVLDNLIANALEATAATALPETALPELSLACRRGRVSFSVADRGTGVAEEYRSRLFRPFFTTKATGSGIGLALARRFAEQAGGSLSWSDRPGGGSVFTVTLPAAAGVKGTNP